MLCPLLSLSHFCDLTPSGMQSVLQLLVTQFPFGILCSVIFLVNFDYKIICFSDPFQPKHNISRYISANMYDYVHFCLLTTTCSLGIPRSVAGPIFGYIGPRPDRTHFDQTPAVLDEYLEMTDKIHELVLRVSVLFFFRFCVFLIKFEEGSILLLTFCQTFTESLFQLDDCYNVPDLQKDNETKAPDLRMQLFRSPVFTELLSLKVVPIPPGKIEASSPPANAYVNWWVTPHQAQYLTGQFRSDAMCLPFSRLLCTDNEVRSHISSLLFVVYLQIEMDFVY